MKNFDSNRFKMVFGKDLRSSWPLFRTTFLIICAIPVAIWLFNLVLGDAGRTEFSPLFRRAMIFITMCLVAIMSPSRIYRTANLPNQGIYYAMLPASHTEKFWSQILMCYIIMPLTAMLVGIGIDLFLTILPIGANVDWIWTRWPCLTDKDDIMTSLNGPQEIIDFLGNFWLMLLGYVMCILSYAATFFFTNTLFKKNKVAKTILWLILLGFVFNLIVTPLLMALLHNVDFVDLLKRFSNWMEWNPRQFLIVIYWGSMVVNAIYIVLFSWWASHRLKKMAY